MSEINGFMANDGEFVVRLQTGRNKVDIQKKRNCL